MTLERKFRLALILGCLGVLAFGMLAICTPWGVGISPDSVVYIAGARSLVAGNGYGTPTGSGEYAPITHYPPLYSVLIAAVGYTGFDLLEGARWMNAALFAANVVLAGFLVLVSTGSLFLSVIASLLMMTPFPLVQAHSMVWSEPLFILLGLLGITLLAEGLERQSRRILLIAATALGFSVLARYVGVAFLTAGVVGILSLGSGTRRAKMRAAALFFAVGLLPFGLWTARNLLVAGTATNRKLGYYPPVAGHLEAVLDTASTWLLSSAVPFQVRIMVFFMLLTLAVWFF